MIIPPPSQALIDLHFDPRVVPPSGTGSSGVCIVAEAPGRWEAEYGIVLHPKAEAGSVFDRALRRANIQRDTLTLSNVAWMRPPGNELAGTPYLWEAKQYWMPFNEALIQERRPRVIVLLGNISLGAFTQFGMDDKTTILHMQGYTLWDPKRECYLLPCLHPSFILHGQQAHNQTLIWILQRAFQLLKSGNHPLPTQYEPYPTEDCFLKFEREFNPESDILAYDIETPESAKLDEAELEDTQEDVSYDIKRVSMCYDGQAGRAISCPWIEPFIGIAKRMLARCKRREVWNNYFDDPRLRAAGATLGGRLYDRMQSWRFLQPTLPASLEYASPLLGWTNPPWKYVSESQPEFYSCVDAHALRRNGMAIEAALKARGMLEMHDRHVIEVYEVAQMMSRNGLPYKASCPICDAGGKCEETPEEFQCAAGFKRKLEKLKEEREAELQTRVPESLKPLKQKTGYKKTPKSTEGLVQRPFKVKWDDLSKLQQIELTTQHSLTPEQIKLLIETEVLYHVERYAQLKPFLPTSHVQMKALIKWAGFKTGTNRKTKKETSDDETKRKIIARCINSSRKKDQEFAITLKMCREVSQLSKVLGTYVKGWRPSLDGKIHSTPGFWGKMFRISWRNPNVSATIQDKQEEFIAAGFRKCVCTTSDRILVEADWKGIEAVIVGYLADDPNYIRLAKMGVHDYFGCYLLYDRGKIPHSSIPSLSLPDEELRKALKFVKKEFPKDRDDAKHTVHGSNYGMTAPLLSSLYELPIAQAEELLKLYFALFPKIKAWQESIKEKASREVWLQNPFGYRMPFWEVYRWNSHRYEILAKAYDRVGKMGSDGMPWKPNMRERGWIREIEQQLKLITTGKVEDAISKLCWDLGDDAKSAISFLPRDTAAGMLRELLLRIRPLAEEGFLCASAHDAVLCDTPRSQQNRIEELLYTEMTRPVPELGNLVVDVEIKAGPAWDSEGMEVVDISQKISQKISGLHPPATSLTLS